MPERVVFDCNVFFQALTSPAGPAARLLEFASRRKVLLFVSAYALDELRDVSSRPHLVAKFQLEASVVAEFITRIEAFATFVDLVPHVFDLHRDPDDAHYINLALAANAKLIVSRDKDLLTLRDDTTLQGQEFRQRFPELAILTPPEALSLLDAQQQAP